MVILYLNLSIFTLFLKNRNIISKIRRSKITDYAALRFTKMVKCLPEFEYIYCILEKYKLIFFKIRRPKVTDYASGKVICLSRLLHMFANIIDLCMCEGSQCGPRSESYLGLHCLTKILLKYFCWRQMHDWHFIHISFLYYSLEIIKFHTR